MTKRNKLLKIESKQKVNGISINILGKEYKIEYPENIWLKTPFNIRQVLLENLAFAETHFLPLILGKEKIKYNTNYPLFDPAFYKNQLMDMLDCEEEDKVEHLTYLRQFYNLEFEFNSSQSTLPNFNKIPKFNNKKITAVIPFSFGKESLVTLALCQELGIEPILVYCQEPVQPYEEKYKLKKLAEIEKKFKVKTYFIKHGPGLFRYGQAFKAKKKSEIGWGSQTTILSLLMIPFVYAVKARYILFGSEYLNNSVKIVKGWKVYCSADQSNAISFFKNNLGRLLTNNQCEIKSSLESLDEMSIFYILHHRYAKYGQYQFSCYAEKPLLAQTQWCHRCEKCSFNFLLARCCDFKLSSLGFKKDLLNEPGQFLYIFDKKIKSYPDQDLGFALHWLLKRKLPSIYLAKFKKLILPELKSWSWNYNFFTKLKPALNLPELYKKKMIGIFKEELKSFKKLLPIK